MQHNIYKSAAQVTVFSTVEKILSFFYRIFLSRVIGAEGLGIYQICLTVFAVFLTAASSGVPVTVSRLMAKNNATGDIHGKNAAVTAGVVCTLMVTIPVACILFLCRGLLNVLFSDSRCRDIFLLLLPGLILTSIYAVMRGAFWGNKQFLPYSIIELLEDFLMVAVGCVLLYNTRDPLEGAKLAIIAVLISYVFSFVASIAWYLKKGGKFCNPKPQLKPLLAASAPITAMRTSASLINSAVAVLLPILLMKSFSLSSSEAISIYGVVIGMSVPLLFIPSSLIGSISVVVAPELSENYYKNKRELVNKDIEKSIKAAIFIAALLVPVLFVLGNEIGVVLYSNETSGQVVQRSAFVLFPMCLTMITTTVLNSMNKEKYTLLFYFIGAAAMLLCIVLLTKYAGAYSYIIGLALSFFITATLNLVLLKKLCPDIKFYSYLIKAVLVVSTGCVMGVLLDGILNRYVSEIWQALICAPVSVGFTAAALYCLEMFTFKPLKRIISKNRQ